MTATRASDERLLKWLRLYEAGMNFSQIARLYRTHKRTVQRAIRAVMEVMG